MTTFLIILLIVLIVVLTIAPIIFLQVRKVLRIQKNYERGLKMVPLLIHLPPPSEDTEVNGRDVRDVMDETVSRAQIIYKILASTYVTKWKAKFYGQRHFTFEIVGIKGFVYFYTYAPIGLVEIVKQAIISAYPTARIEEVTDYNIFNQVGKMTATIGGEFVLKKPFAYPIASFQDLKRDAMQTLLNSVASLGPEDGVGVQILLRPADPAWQKVANDLANNKRKGKKDHKGLELIVWFVKSFFTALSKPLEEDKKDQENKKELSSMEQGTYDAIDEKTKYPGYETCLRIIVSSNVSQRAQELLHSVVASFSLYDAPGRNGLKFNLTKDINSLVTDYIMRFFPQENNKMILNAVELASLFHFPDQNNIPTSQVRRQESKQVDGPRNVPDEGLLLGYNVFRGTKKPIRLSTADRQRHTYAVGQTGTGKSNFLENLALQDMLDGNGFAFVDPHGDTAEKLLSMVPKERTEDVIYFCPADMEFPMGLNLFEYDEPDQKDFLIQEALNMLYKLYDPNHQGIMGPRYEHLFRMAALTVMADPAGGTFIDIPKLFRDPKYVQQKLQYVKDLNVTEFWTKEMPNSQRSNDFGEVVSWFVSKFGAFLSNEMMRNIIGQNKSAFNLRDVMDNKKILLVNLSKGRTGDLNSKLLGMIFVMKFQAAAMSRSNIPEDERVDFCLYVDEFQNFSTDSFATIMSEARKYHLNLIVANQFTTQLTEEIRDAVFGNMGTIVAFRIGQNDVESLGRYFNPTFDADDLLRVPNYNCIVRTLIGGVPTQPFSMATIPPLGTPNPRLGEALKQLSSTKYGRSRTLVEKEIFDRMKTKEESKPPINNPFNNSNNSPNSMYGNSAGASVRPNSSYATTPSASPFATSTTSAMPSGASSSSSFLDDWLTKKKNSAAVASKSTANPSSLAASSPVGVSAAPPWPQPANPLTQLTPPSQPSYNNMSVANNLSTPVPDAPSLPLSHQSTHETIADKQANQPINPYNSPLTASQPLTNDSLKSPYLNVNTIDAPTAKSDMVSTTAVKQSDNHLNNHHHLYGDSDSQTSGQDEIDRIADQLRTNLKTVNDSPQAVKSQIPTTTTELPKEPVIMTQPHESDQESYKPANDTIYIDHEGNIRSR